MSSDTSELFFLLVLYAGYAVYIVLRTAILWLHRIVAWTVLVLFRDVIVHLIGWKTSERLEKIAVLHWVILLPCALFASWCIVITGELSRPGRYLPLVVSLPIAAASGGLLVIEYLKRYRQTTVLHPTWPRFIAAAVALGLDTKLAYIETKFRIKTWWRR